MDEGRISLVRLMDGHNCDRTYLWISCIGESMVVNGRWKRGEQYGQDGTASTLFNPRVAAYQAAYCAVVAKEGVW